MHDTDDAQLRDNGEPRTGVPAGDSAPFRLLPAIDLRGGRVVRLREGDFARETVYGDDPVEVARTFAAAGARFLHIVDLDGAREGAPRQAEVIAAVVRGVAGQIECEIAGGLRTDAAVEVAFATGAARVVVGTAALRDPGFAAGLVARYGADRVVVAIDVRAGQALGEGWRSGAPGVPASDAIARLADVGVETFEVTAIDRDGLLSGPDLATLAGFIAAGRGRVIASAGITTVEDLRAVMALGCAGAIVGRALYEGQLDLREALAATASVG